MPAAVCGHRRPEPRPGVRLTPAVDGSQRSFALPDIGRDFGHSGLSNLSWILNGYAIFFSALLVPPGRFADKYRRKASFITGLAVFTLASLCCAVSPNLWTLVGFRCVQAAGAAILTPRASVWLTPRQQLVDAVVAREPLGASVDESAS